MIPAAKLERLLDRYAAIESEMASGATGSHFVTLSREHAELSPVIEAARASGKPVPYRCVARRPGDVAACYADPARARELLNWQATRGLDAMCQDSWRWQSNNPQGFVKERSASPEREAVKAL